MILFTRSSDFFTFGKTFLPVPAAPDGTGSRCDIKGLWVGGALGSPARGMCDVARVARDLQPSGIMSCGSHETMTPDLTHRVRRCA